MMNTKGLNRNILVILCLVAGLASCKNVESDVGSNFFQNHSNVVVVDTLTVKLETVYLDSVPTNGMGVILTGGYQDTLTGNKLASSYMQLGAPSVQSISSTSVYDSLRFILRPNKYVLGDSTQPFSLAVHALDEPITIPAGDVSLYNTSSFDYESSVLGSWTGRIYPTRTEQVSIPLTDQLGQTLFHAIVSNPQSLSTENLFTHNYLKGVVITSGSNQTIYGFAASDSSGFMRLYYHNPNNTKEALTTDFRITTTGLQFNHVSNDKSQTAYAALNGQTPGKGIDASLTGRRSVLQPLSNLAIRMSFPYLKNLGHLGRYVEIMSARLILKPDPTTYFRDYPLPPALSLCETVNFYTVLDSLQSSFGIQHGNLVADYSYHNSYYTYDISQYMLRAFHVTSNNNKTELLLIPPMPAYNAAFPRLILGSQTAKNRGIEVSVQLVTYNTH